MDLLLTDPIIYRLAKTQNYLCDSVKPVWRPSSNFCTFGEAFSAASVSLFAGAISFLGLLLLFTNVRLFLMKRQWIMF